ncbi:MAG: nitrite reductase small subunit NirD [Nitrospirota bacterium]|nr:nitrite reductase small subunit NirD [Nitrospirota bacterium]
MPTFPLEDFVLVAKVEDVPDGKGKVVKAKGKQIALFRVKEAFYAINNVCPHQGASLAKGRLKRYVVSCPLHDLQFDIRSGFQTDGGGCRVAGYDVHVENGNVYVKPKARSFI